MANGTEKQNNTILDNMKKGYENSGDMFKMAGESFSGGNITGGIYQGAMGALSALGNTITLGYATAIGENAWANIDDKIEIVPEYYTDSEGNNLHGYLENGQIVVNDEKDDNGNYKCGLIPTGRTEMKETNGKLGFLERYWLVHEAEGVNLQRELTQQGELGTANALGAVDTAGLVLDVVGGAGLLSSARTAVFGATQKEITKGLTEYTAKEGLAAAAKEVAGDAAEAGMKTAAKEAAETIAEESAERAAKEAIKQGTKEITESAAEAAAKNGIKSAFSASDRIAMGNLMKSKAGVAAKLIGAGNIAGSIALNSYRADFAANHTPVETAKAAAGSLMGSVAGSVDNMGDTVKETVSNAANDFLSRHKGIAKVVNSCKAAAEATSVTASKMVPTSYAVATCSVAKAKVDSFVTGADYKYMDGNENKKSISEVAADLREDAQSDKRSWTQIYSDKVTELDKQYGIDRTAGADTHDAPSSADAHDGLSMA